ncbi:hypothetical protein ABFS82_06G032600 [Erythranthe guttata]|uniref:kinesin-like protein KIF22 isoform X1 n=1 Tax=Erythranthe guttata TaxID=4155 RepID=UPI00064E057D|nr:PREDICTED: kinesin-like protein KIF22 isoform X1 [Erythranthe guttata]|eukprot:XP_012852124.1 PREDICTED: kinesin-like protein KIF22 isoform X1 [Erythranthe guttata]
MAEPQSARSNRFNNSSKKVRLIGKIRGLTVKESESLSQDSKPWITVKHAQGDGSSEVSTVFLNTEPASRRDGYELDYCYEQREEIGQMYSREIQPLISEVFDGRNVSVIALGARGSGKTYTIQGCREKPGLAVLAMSEILSETEKLGKSVSVSLYELTQEHVKDLLNPNHPVIQVLEDAQGVVNLKGLSKVSVKSITEFHNVYFGQANSRSTQTKPTELPRNKGLMVHISSEDSKVKSKPANKINFVDLAGYEDPRKSCRDENTPAESSCKNNKLLHALLNVISAINSNEIRVPYRESKLTRILQDSLGGTSRVLLLTCLNPIFCQDSLSFMSLISRSCRGTRQVLTDSTNRSQSGKINPASLSAKKPISHSRLLSTKKASCILKGRKLFEEAKSVNPKQLKCQSRDTKKSEVVRNLELVVAPFSLEELKCESQDTSAQESEAVQNLELVVAPFSLEEVSHDNLIADCSPKDVLSPSVDKDLGDASATNSDSIVQIHFEADSASTCDESNTLHKKNDGSPPLSERIREIANNLKSICASTPSAVKMPEEVVAAYNSQSQVSYNDTTEPKTPIVELSSARYCSPRGTFTNRSSGVKHSLVKEYLNFLNSATKEELKSLKGIGDKRAGYILELRKESPEPFKSLDDLQDIGVSAKQVKGMMKQMAADLFN